MPLQNVSAPTREHMTAIGSTSQKHDPDGMAYLLQSVSLIRDHALQPRLASWKPTVISANGLYQTQQNQPMPCRKIFRLYLR